MEHFAACKSGRPAQAKCILYTADHSGRPTHHRIAITESCEAWQNSTLAMQADYQYILCKAYNLLKLLRSAATRAPKASPNDPCNKWQILPTVKIKLTAGQKHRCRFDSARYRFPGLAWCSRCLPRVQGSESGRLRKPQINAMLA